MARRVSKLLFACLLFTLALQMGIGDLVDNHSFDAWLRYRDAGAVLLSSLQNY